MLPNTVIEINGKNEKTYAIDKDALMLEIYCKIVNNNNELFNLLA